MLGLERNVDARPPDDTPRDSSAHVCLDEDFRSALDLDRWSTIMPMGITITADQKLVFAISTQAAANDPGILRSKQAFDLRGTEVVARIELRPQLNTYTSFAIASDAGAPLYEMRITPDDKIDLRVNGSSVQSGVALAGNFLRIKFTGNDVEFGSGASAGTFVSTTSPALAPVAKVRAQISAASSTPIGAPIMIHWASILVNCQ